MKSRKFFISSALALSTVLGSVGPMMNAMPVFADETTQATVEFKPSTTHSYVAYKIFKGTLKDNKLTEIEWGEALTTADKKAICVAAGLASEGTAIDALPSAAVVAEKLAEPDFDAIAFTKRIGDLTSPTITLEAGTKLDYGYYLIKDTKDVTGTDDVRGLSLLQVANDKVTIEPKNAKPTVDKEVEDNDAHDDAADGGFGETADHEIGESFQFRLTATITHYGDIKNYDTYKLVFHDTLSAGIDYVSEGDLTAEMFVGDNTTAIEVQTTTARDGQNLTVTIEDLKKSLPETIKDSDQIKVVVKYDAKLNKNAVVAESDVSGVYNNNKVQLEYSNNPSGEGTGKTTEDYVYVFTYELNNTKVDNMGNNLKGAEFVLKNAAGKFASFDEANMFTGWVDAQNKTTKITSDDEGKFKMTGLDAGTYTLVETKAPDGYQEAPDTTIEINAAHAEDEGGATAKVTLTGNNNAGATITDSKISNLPETGGMGTTIFYAAGGILAAGAVIALAATKKAKKEED